jgi:hypothetical protein
VSAETDLFPYRSPAGRCPPGFGASWGCWVGSVDGDESVDGKAVVNRWSVGQWTVVDEKQNGDHWLPATDYRSPTTDHRLRATGYRSPMTDQPIRRGIRPGPDGRLAP